MQSRTLIAAWELLQNQSARQKLLLSPLSLSWPLGGGGKGDWWYQGFIPGEGHSPEGTNLRTRFETGCSVENRLSKKEAQGQFRAGWARREKPGSQGRAEAAREAKNTLSIVGVGAEAQGH